MLRERFESFYVMRDLYQSHSDFRFFLPSPQPSPRGRGRSYSLSLWERVRVRALG